MKPLSLRWFNRIIRDRFVSVENFIHGGWTENPEYHQNRLDRERAEYALKNPWVLRYDLGHRELIGMLPKYRREI